MDDGEIEVDSIKVITLSDITPDLARRSGFKDVAELLAIAKHGRGENIYLIRFHYSPSFLPRVVRKPRVKRSVRLWADLPNVARMLASTAERASAGRVRGPWTARVANVSSSNLLPTARRLT